VEVADGNDVLVGFYFMSLLHRQVKVRILFFLWFRQLFIALQQVFEILGCFLVCVQ
jgi:hypothetical protein